MRPVQNPDYLSVLAPYDLTRGGGYYTYFGHTDVKELALYIQDEIKAGNWDFNLGLREDLYNGLTDANQTQPRLGIAYNIKPSSTVLRISYARTLETPFNENLVLSSSGCSNAVLVAAARLHPRRLRNPRSRLSATSSTPACSRPSASGPCSAANTSGSTPTTPSTSASSATRPSPSPSTGITPRFPATRSTPIYPTIHNFSAYFVASSVAARFFPPQSAGAGAAPQTGGQPFRIDHDEKFNQTTHLQYQIGKRGPWAGGNWRYDSGLVAGAVPFAVDTTTPVDLSGLTFDQQAQAGLTCNGVAATRTAGFQSCAPSQYSSSLVSIPAPGTENDDKNPPRIAPRNLFDLSVGQENLFHKEHYKVDLDLTAINITNKYALYNFLSTFSGTHYVTPRALTAKLTLNF